jgi:hypothetical protein
VAPPLIAATSFAHLSPHLQLQLSSNAAQTPQVRVGAPAAAAAAASPAQTQVPAAAAAPIIFLVMPQSSSSSSAPPSASSIGQLPAGATLMTMAQMQQQQQQHHVVAPQQGPPSQPHLAVAGPFPTGPLHHHHVAAAAAPPLAFSTVMPQALLHQAQPHQLQMWPGAAGGAATPAGGAGGWYGVHHGGGVQFMPQLSPLLPNNGTAAGPTVLYPLTPTMATHHGAAPLSFTVMQPPPKQ